MLHVKLSGYSTLHEVNSCFWVAILRITGTKSYTSALEPQLNFDKEVNVDKSLKTLYNRRTTTIMPLLKTQTELNSSRVRSNILDNL